MSLLKKLQRLWTPEAVMGIHCDLWNQELGEEPCER